MNKPTLLIMAAGMGSRYGGLKQLDEVTGEGEAVENVVKGKINDAKTIIGLMLAKEHLEK